jgi:peptide/nickel transport system substrate-binding protein
VRGKSFRLLLLLATLLLALGLAGCGGDDDDGEAQDTGATETDGGEAAGGTLVFAAAADPVVLDGALVSDGESIRAITQLFETLVFLEPGTTNPVPGLAESWEPNEDGTVWTFAIRPDVTFHDGEPLTGEAVCANFDRWYNFTGPLQNPSASYYWQVVFGGFAEFDPESGAPEESLYQSCEAPDESTAVITLTKPSATFIPALAQQAFGIASPAALEQYDADAGTVDEEGVFQPTGTFGTEHPIGTGPFKFQSWTRGESLELVRNDDYWGEEPEVERLIFRPIADNAARLQALQTGEVQGYDLVEPQDVETIEGDANLQLLERPPFNVGYITINQSKPPMDNPLVRQAVAHAINKEEVVNSFYGGRGVVATQFQPQEIFGWASDVPTYEFNPDRSRQLLQQAGLTLPVEVEFWWPTDVTRDYMPDPRRNFEAFAAQLNAAGFRVQARTAPWRPDYVSRVNEGNAGHLNLIGWIADFADPDNFIGTFFQSPSAQFGFEVQEIHDLLDEAESETDPARRTELYEEANRQIMANVPGVPYVHATSALAFEANVQGFVPSPVGVGGESFASVTIGEAEEEGEETEETETDTETETETG